MLKKETIIVQQPEPPDSIDYLYDAKGEIQTVISRIRDMYGPEAFEEIWALERAIVSLNWVHHWFRKHPDIEALEDDEDDMAIFD